MKLDVAQYGTNAAVLLTVFNPATDAAQDPTTATVSFYSVATGAFVAVLGPQALAQVDGNVGIWGALVALGTQSLPDLVAIATAVVAGVTRSATQTFGPGKTSAVGAPRITVTAGPVVDDAAGPGV